MDEDDLERNCLHVIDGSATAAFKSEAFTGITQATLEKIVRRDTLNIEEIDVYKACVNWAEAECNRQNLAVNICFCQCKGGYMIWGRQPSMGSADIRGGRFYTKMYVKTKLFGLVGGVCSENF